MKPVSMTKLRNIKIVAFLTSVSETSENLYFFDFISSLVSFVVYIYVQYFFDMVRNKLETIKNIYTKVNKKKIKSSRKEHVM